MSTGRDVAHILRNINSAELVERVIQKFEDNIGMPLLPTISDLALIIP
jgi:hypothetical protein